MKSVINYVLFLFLMTSSFSFAQIKQIRAVKPESAITYKISHMLHEVESKSQDAYCIVDVDPNKKEIKKVFVQVDVMSFNSGNSNRDSHAMEVIDALSFPDSRFTSTSITQTGDSLKIYGQLVFHGITKDVVISALAKWSNNKLIVTGSFDVSLTAFNVERPSLMLIKVNDILKFTLTQSFNI